MLPSDLLGAVLVRASGLVTGCFLSLSFVYATRQMQADLWRFSVLVCRQNNDVHGDGVRLCLGSYAVHSFSEILLFMF